MEGIDNKKVPTKKELLLSRMRTKYPDDNFEVEEALFGKINDDYDQYDKDISDRDSRLAEYEKNEKAFGEMFTKDPRAARFLETWRDGGDPVIAILTEYGTEIKDVIDDPERLEEIAKANKMHAETKLQEEQYEKEYTDNLKASLEYLDSLKEKGKMSDDEIDEVLNFIMAIVRDGISGKFSPETIALARKALNYDKDVAEAGEDGVVKGRNAKIEETLKKAKAGDGVANLGGNNGGNVRKMPSLGALDKYGDDSNDIWSRGGETRTPVKRY